MKALNPASRILLWVTAGPVIFVVLAALLLLAVMPDLTDLTDLEKDLAAGPTKVLLDAGYSDVNVGATVPGEFSLTCGAETLCTSFEATGPTGRPVRGFVECNFTRSCIIKFW